jgi:hypothetical protein
MVNNMLTPE